MIAAVATVLNEEQIIWLTIEHLLAHGVDRVYVAHGPSTDSTLKILEDFGDEVVIVDDPSPIHYQPKQINDLAFLAHTEGFEWIIPFDADEFWCPVDESYTISETLKALPDGVTVLKAAQYGYHSLQYRLADPWPNSKVAYRYHTGARVANGNHSVAGLEGTVLGDVLVVRELQFQSLAHMREKSTLRVQTLDPELDGGEGVHQRVFAAMSDEELAAQWHAMDVEYSTFDPINVRSR